MPLHASSWPCCKVLPLLLARHKLNDKQMICFAGSGRGYFPYPVLECRHAPWQMGSMPCHALPPALSGFITAAPATAG